MNEVLKKARLAKSLKTREVAEKIGIDQALISKFESGKRLPTKKQILQLAGLLDINANELLTQWMKERIVKEIGYSPLAVEALHLAENTIKYRTKEKVLDSDLKTILEKINTLKSKLDKARQFDSYRIAEALELEYTYESNRIEGNTLTLKETDLVINEGLTIAGKSMREHLEALNHKEAIGYVKSLINEDSNIYERTLLNIQQLILKSIDSVNAGKYRNVQVMIKGSRHNPPQPFLVAKQMEDFFIWFEENKYSFHPVILAAEMHERLVTIHPFIDGNGRTSRLLMNLILLKHGYVIANIKGDAASKMNYYNALEKAQADGDNSDFLKLVANTELDALKRYVDIIEPQH